jgi:hypothetical protein
VRLSPQPGFVLSHRFAFIDASTFEAELSAALQILDEVGADPWDYAQVHVIAAVMAAVFGNLTLAGQEAALAVEFSRRIGNPSVLGIALYGSALASWQSDPIAAVTALEEHISIAGGRSAAPGVGLRTDYILARSLALLAQLRARRGDRAAALESLRKDLESARLNGDRPATAVCLARGAVIMPALGERETAAAFLGSLTSSVVARRGGVSPSEIPDYDEFVTTLRSKLGEDLYKAATARGAAMTYEQASAFALAAIEGLRPN